MVKLIVAVTMLFLAYSTPALAVNGKGPDANSFGAHLKTAAKAWDAVPACAITPEGKTDLSRIKIIVRPMPADAMGWVEYGWTDETRTAMRPISCEMHLNSSYIGSKAEGYSAQDDCETIVHEYGHVLGVSYDHKSLLNTTTSISIKQRQNFTAASECHALYDSSYVDVTNGYSYRFHVRKSSRKQRIKRAHRAQNASLVCKIRKDK
jgi:hypothetical protein